jgi:hypothetical protein
MLRRVACWTCGSGQMFKHRSHHHHHHHHHHHQNHHQNHQPPPPQSRPQPPGVRHTSHSTLPPSSVTFTRRSSPRAAGLHQWADFKNPSVAHFHHRFHRHVSPPAHLDGGNTYHHHPSCRSTLTRRIKRWRCAPAAKAFTFLKALRMSILAS